MNPDDLRVSKSYRGNRFRGRDTGPNNDRTIVWMNSIRSQVQYDSDTVATGRRLPIVKIEQFAKWAKRQLTPAEVDLYHSRGGKQQ